MDTLHENEIADRILDTALALHRDLGPGLLESVYEVLLAHTIEESGLKVQRQVIIPIRYKDINLDEGFRADLIVEQKVILELKSVERTNPAHKKQLLTYLKLSGLKLGFLLNFGEALMKDGVTRIINGHLPPCSPCRPSFALKSYGRQAVRDKYRPHHSKISHGGSRRFIHH